MTDELTHYKTANLPNKWMDVCEKRNVHSMSTQDLIPIKSDADLESSLNELNTYHSRSFLGIMFSKLFCLQF